MCPLLEIFSIILDQKILYRHIRAYMAVSENFFTDNVIFKSSLVKKIRETRLSLELDVRHYIVLLCPDSTRLQQYNYTRNKGELCIIT